MKNKIYFICSSIVQLIIAVLVIINANQIAGSMTDEMSIYPDEIAQSFSGSWNGYVIVCAVISILLYSLLIRWAYKDKLLKNKGKVIAILIYSLIMSFYPLAMLIAIISLIVIICTKREKPEDYPDAKKPMPKLERESVNKKKILLAIILLVVYFSVIILRYFIPSESSKISILSLIFYIGMMILSIVFFRELLTNNFKVFKDNIKIYFQNLVGVVGKFYLAYLGIVILSIVIFGLSPAANQQTVESLPLWFSAPLAILYAPLVEETLFRGCIRRFIKNDTIFIIVSGIVFGLLHTIFAEATLYRMLTNAIPYATLGGFLAYLYVKTNNICTNMAFHAFQNTMAVVLMIILKGF